MFKKPLANSVDPAAVQTAPIGAVWSGSTLFASILNSSVMLGKYLQQTTSADDIADAFFLGASKVKSCVHAGKSRILIFQLFPKKKKKKIQ